MRLALLPIVVATLAGCASTSSPPAAPATDLTVHVAVFGGPMRPDGDMAASNVPQRDARVTVTDTAGRTWAARTDRRGIASFAVPTGHYFVHVPCGQVDAEGYAVRTGQVERVRLRCDVP